MILSIGLGFLAGLRVLRWIQRYLKLLDHLLNDLRIDFNFLVRLVLVILQDRVRRHVIRNLGLLGEDVKSVQRRTIWLTLLGLIKIFNEPGVVANLLDCVSFIWVRI